MTATGVDLRSLAQATYEAFNAHDPHRLLGQVDDEYEQTIVPTGQTFQGKDGFVDSMQTWIDGFSDARVEVRAIVAEGDTVIGEFRGLGTHDGTFQTPMGALPATGRTVDIPFCHVMTFRNGKVYRDRLYFDVLTILSQLGIDPGANQPA